MKMLRSQNILHLVVVGYTQFLMLFYRFPVETELDFILSKSIIIFNISESEFLDARKENH